MAKTTINCTNCGAASAVGENFCGECGARLPAAIPAAPVAPVESLAESETEAPPTTETKSGKSVFRRRKGAAFKEPKKAKPPKSVKEKSAKEQRPNKAPKVAAPAKQPKPVRKERAKPRLRSGASLILWPSSILSATLFYLLVALAIGLYLLLRYPDYVLKETGLALVDILGQSLVVLAVTLIFMFVRRLIFKSPDN